MKHLLAAFINSLRKYGTVPAIFLCFALSTSELLAESRTDAGNTRFSLGSRVFDLRVDTRRFEVARNEGFLPIGHIRWIKEYMDVDPHLRGVFVYIEDRGRGPGIPGWLPDIEARIHYDPTLPLIFSEDIYNVGWIGKNIPSTRGTVLLTPKHDPESYYVRCPYDRANTGPSFFCSVDTRYVLDSDLWLRIRVYRPTQPLNDFAEIAARIQALVFCLDVTDEITVSAENTIEWPFSGSALDIGGACRIQLLS